MVRGETFFAASRAFTNEDGTPVLWKIRPISTRENESIRESCVVEVPVPGQNGVSRSKLDVSRYTARLLAASVVEPNLYDKQLQDSYGVMTPEDLILELLDNPAEYKRFADFVQEFNGFGGSFEEKVELAKN